MYSLRIRHGFCWEIIEVSTGILYPNARSFLRIVQSRFCVDGVDNACETLTGFVQILENFLNAVLPFGVPLVFSRRLKRVFFVFVGGKLQGVEYVLFVYVLVLCVYVYEFGDRGDQQLKL